MAYKDPEKRRAYNAAWRAANPEKRRASNAAWATANPEKRRASNAAWYAANSEKKRASIAAWRAANPDKIRGYNAAWGVANRDKKRRYRGLPTPTRPAPARCECCGTLYAKTLHLDHCHVSGIFRGWACGSCNRGIGLLGDDIAGVMKAVRYLERVVAGAVQ
jgi:hypothetical protein